MLALDSSRWETLRASGGGSGTVARRVLTEIHAGTGSDWPGVPPAHSRRGDLRGRAACDPLGGSAALPERFWPLGIAGTVAACRAAFPSAAPPVPDDLRADYEGAAHTALLMATAALGEPGLRRGEVVELLGVVAAFQGHSDLALHLFLHSGSDRDLHCPKCGEYIRWREGAERDDKALDAANPFLT